MMNRIKFFLIPALIFSFFLTAKEDLLTTKVNKKIRVLIEKDASEALLEVRGPYYIFNSFDRSKVSSGLLGKRFIVHATPNGLRWGGVYPGVHQITISPRSPDTAILIDGIQYDGDILVYRVGNKICVVNQLPIESYIKSILTQEFTIPLDNEVLSSIAIAARTTAYYHATKHEGALWDVKAEDVSYQGKALIIEDSALISAIDATKNLILLNSVDGKHVPFVAKWNEHSAGKTAALNVIYRKDQQAPAIGVEAQHAALDRDESKWTLSIPVNEFAKLVHVSEDIRAIDTYTDPQSGKIYGIRCKYSQDSTDIDFFALQTALGKDRLRSNDFRVEIKNSTVVFTGHGIGDGVGICLYSASAMAQNGDMAVKILSKFFPETFLVNLSATAQIADNQE